MFLLLMLVSLVTAIATTAIVVAFFRGPISGILGRIVAEPVAAAWRRYVSFALLVVGVSSGVSLWTLERYVQGRPGDPGSPPSPSAVAAAFPAPLTTEAWVFEVYRTVLGSLKGLSGALLLFFGIALVVSGIQRGLGERAGAGEDAGARRAQDRSRGRGLPSPPNGRSNEGRSSEPRRPLGPGGGSPGRRGDIRSREGEGRSREGEGRSREGEGRSREGDLRRDLRGARPPESRGGEERGREARPGETGTNSAPRVMGDGRSPDWRPQNGDLARNGALERRPLPNRS